MIDSEKLYTKVTSEQSIFISKGSPYTLLADDILEKYGKCMTWDIKAGLMGKRMLSDP